MKIYQGESVSFLFRVVDGDDISKYNIRATLTSEQLQWERDCCCRSGVLYWDNIPIIENIGVWEISPAQSDRLPEGKYLLEIALYNKSDGKPVKMQVQQVVEVVHSYIAIYKKCH